MTMLTTALGGRSAALVPLKTVFVSDCTPVSSSLGFGFSALCAHSVGNLAMPEEGFDPGPDEEDYIPWDCDKD